MPRFLLAVVSVSALFAFASSASGAPCSSPAFDGAAFSCVFGEGAEFLLTVDGAPPFSYAVSSSSSGAVWLDGGSIAISQNGSMLTPANNLSVSGPVSCGDGIDPTLGVYSYLSVPWVAETAASGSTRIVANFTCFRDYNLAALSAHFPDGASGVATLPPQAMGSGGLDGGNARPSLHFPSFSLTSLLGPQMGYIEWAGEMSSYDNNHGVGLSAYKGGQKSGPLCLFNKTQLVPGTSKPASLVLGPGLGDGAFIAHQILGVVPDPAGTGGPTATAGCTFAPHTDEVGSSNAPGSGEGIVVQAGNASACCAACAALGAENCDSWVYDTDGEAGGNNCWPLIGIKGSKQGMSDRALGIMWTPPACASGGIQNGTAAAGGGSTPSEGFEAGSPVASAGECCVLCATLGVGACAAWTYEEEAPTSPLCFPLLSWNGTVARPNASFGIAGPRPQVLAGGPQGYIESYPAGFASV